MESAPPLHRTDIKGYDSLESLALNLRSSWNHSTDVIWSQLDPELWELTHNPWAVLQTVSREKLESILADHKFSKLINDLVNAREAALSAPSWFEENHSSVTSRKFLPVGRADFLSDQSAEPEGTFEHVVEGEREEMRGKMSPYWQEFTGRNTGSPLSCVAYFSMEFMLSEALPIYSGGLGNVAGDQLKAA